MRRDKQRPRMGALITGESMADDGETRDYELSAMVVVSAEQLHERYCMGRIMDGKEPADFETYLNVLVIEGMRVEAARLESKDCINDTLVAAIRENRGDRVTGG